MENKTLENNSSFTFTKKIQSILIKQIVKFITNFVTLDIQCLERKPNFSLTKFSFDILQCTEM